MVSIPEVLGQWESIGIFSYVIPFLLVFAVVFSILTKSKILGENKGVNVLVSLAVALLSLIGGAVPSFFASIFPKFGIGLAIFLVILILGGLLMTDSEMKQEKWLYYAGPAIGIAVAVWAFGWWNTWTMGGVGPWFYENFWTLVVGAVVVGAIIYMIKGSAEGGGKSGKGP
jgi:hypothetical protein